MFDDFKTDPKALRSAFIDGMSQLASSVSVVTTDGPHGRAGLTATSVTSVSADTRSPTLLVCVNRASSSREVVMGNGVLCVNVLTRDQQWIADIFAGRGGAKGAEKFDGIGWGDLSTGSPVLSGALVAFDCRICGVQTIGSHDVVFASVVDVRHEAGAQPLLYSARRYAHLARARHKARGA